MTSGPIGAGHYLLNRTGEDLFLIALRCGAYHKHCIHIVHLSRWNFSRKKMSSKRKEYHVHSRAKHAAISFVACEPNPTTFIKIPSAMRAKWYSDKETENKTMQMQVHREIGKARAAKNSSDQHWQYRVWVV